MRTLRSLTGMPVVCGQRRVGFLLRGELSEDLRQLEGVWVSAGLRGTRYIPAEGLEILGRVAVLAEDAGRRGKPPSKPLLMRAVSTDGRRLGAITGAQVDEVSFAVTALELSAGLWDDLLRGRQVVTRYTVNPGSGEVVIDPAEADGEEGAHEGRIDEGADRRDGDRRIGGYGIRHHELADGKAVEPEGQADRQLDL